ncbi:hypothetical protein BsWGS_09601 [Bradybaena similaris]
MDIFKWRKETWQVKYSVLLIQSRARRWNKCVRSRRTLPSQSVGLLELIRYYHCDSIRHSTQQVDTGERDCSPTEVRLEHIFEDEKIEHPNCYF